MAQDYHEARLLYCSAMEKGHVPASKNLDILEDKLRSKCPQLGKQVVIKGASQEDMDLRCRSYFHRAENGLAAEEDKEERPSIEGSWLKWQ